VHKVLLEIKDYQVPLVIPGQQVPKVWLVQPARLENKDYLVPLVILVRLGRKA
jgi:hypothetical protein